MRVANLANKLSGVKPKPIAWLCRDWNVEIEPVLKRLVERDEDYDQGGNWGCVGQGWRGGCYKL